MGPGRGGVNCRRVVGLVLSRTGGVVGEQWHGCFERLVVEALRADICGRFFVGMWRYLSLSWQEWFVVGRIGQVVKWMTLIMMRKSFS